MDIDADLVINTRIPHSGSKAWVFLGLLTSSMRVPAACSLANCGDYGGAAAVCSMESLFHRVCCVELLLASNGATSTAVPWSQLLRSS